MEEFKIKESEIVRRIGELEALKEELNQRTKKIKELIDRIVGNRQEEVLRSREKNNYIKELMPYIESKNKEIAEGLNKSLENLKRALNIHIETERINEEEAKKLEI